MKNIIPKSKFHVLLLKISLFLTLIPILGGNIAFANSSYLDLPEPVTCEYQGYEPEHKEEMHFEINTISRIIKNKYARLLFTESNNTEYVLLIPMHKYPYSKSIWLDPSDKKEEISVHKPVTVIFNPPGERAIKNISALLPPESWQGYPSIIVLYNDKKEERIYVAYRKGPGNDDIAWSIADATNFHIMFGDTIKLIAKVIIAPIAIPVFVVTLPLQIGLGIAAYSRSPKEYEPHSYFNSVAFSPDGKYALSGNSDNAVKFWNIETGQNIRVFKGHSCEVESTAFSPNGKYALSGSMDKTIKLWDLDSGLLIRTFKGHARRVKSVAFSHDGRRVLSGSWDQTVKIWDVESGNEIRSFQKESSKFHKVHLSIYSIAISPNGLYALSGSSGTEVNLWEIESGKHIRTFLGHQYQDVKSVAFSPDGRYALSGGDYKDATMKLWEVSSGWEIGSIAQSGNVNSVAFSPDGRYALSCNDYGGVLLWDLGTHSLIRKFEGHRGKVRSVAFSPDGRLILSGSEDESMKLWDVESGQEIRTFKAKTEETPRICGKVGDDF